VVAAAGLWRFAPSGQSDSTEEAYYLHIRTLLAPPCGQILMSGRRTSHTVPSVLLMGRGFRSVVALLAVVAGTCLLIDLSPAQAASGSAQVSGSKAKRGKACKKKRYRRVPCKNLKHKEASIRAVPRTVSLTWDSTADIDLKIYDLGGRRAGLVNGTLVNEFPGATFSGNDTDGFGPETFGDPSGRRVGYLVCYVSGPRANVTLIDSGRQGGRYTATLGPAGSPSDADAYTTSAGWGYLPIGAHC
jgi:hypothetical protein